MKRNDGGSADAVALIQRYIRDEGLSDGATLPTHERLGRRLKLGPRRLREGLSVLEHHRLIETRRKAGTIVRRPEARHIAEPIGWVLDAHDCTYEDLIRARAHVEAAAAHDAAQRRTPRDLLAMLAALDDLEACIADQRPDEAQDEAFHQAILDATHNPAMKTFGRLIHLDFSLKPPETPSRDRCQVVHRQHRLIYRAIEAGKASLAMKRMREHVMGTIEKY